MSESYPVLPLPGVVMFPALMTQIQTQDPYAALLQEEIGRFDNHFLTTMMVEEDQYFYQTGCVVRLEDYHLTDKGASILTIRGIQKFYIEECPITHPIIYASGKVLSDYYEDEDKANHDMLPLTRLVQRYIFLTQQQPDPFLRAVSFMTEPDMLSNFCVHYCEEEAGKKQEMLQTLNINKRIDECVTLLRDLVKKQTAKQGDFQAY